MWKVRASVSWDCDIPSDVYLYGVEVEVAVVIVSAHPCEVRSKVGLIPNPSRSLRVESSLSSPIHAPGRAPQDPATR